MDDLLLYNLQVGRYSSISENITFLLDINHDYKRICQGRISKDIDEAKQELSVISPVDIAPIEKHNRGEEKRLFYIPDFEQDYPT